MRRIKQQLSDNDCVGVLNSGKTAVLAVSGDDGYPYTVPLNYVYYDEKIYFHCAKSGHKLDAIEKNDKVSICIIAQDDVVEEKYTTYFKSVICFGRAKRLKDENKIRTTINALAEKYCSSCRDGIPAEIDRGMPGLEMVEITIDHMTGKQCKELIK